MITNRKVHVGFPENVTTIGSEIQLFCSTNQTRVRKLPSPALTAICEEDGAWSPDISGHNYYECADQENDSEFNIVCMIMDAQTLHYALPKCMHNIKFPRCYVTLKCNLYMHAMQILACMTNFGVYKPLA